MINAKALLADLTRLLKGLETDLRERIEALPDLRASLHDEWKAARDANRNAETFESWSEQVITQAGVHWLLSCVFLRFIEDNQLVERPWISGPAGDRLGLARDRHESYFRAHPTETDRDYLISCFREAGKLPGLVTFFDEAHNPVFRMGISGDAAIRVLQFWQQIEPGTGSLKHDFTDQEWNTRFLGDLYQDLSEATRKRYALLQTPEFVEEFILDRTLTPAIREFGFREVRMIDPTCGSGHFLLGGFYRLVEEWANAEPGRNRRDIAQKALDAVAGVDLNPFAVAIARFRLWVAALKVSEVNLLSAAPDFKLSIAIGDSLLHGKRFGMTSTDEMFADAEHYEATGLSHAYASEDLEEVGRILGRQYHAVVGNPPYIVVKDSALNAAYRQRYVSCHKRYSLGAPFTERFFDLAITGNSQPAGFVGLITANSFMKREFGSKLIEYVLPRLDLTHVVDTSGAYIPGHGTPTVIIYGRHRLPIVDSVRTVMGIKGEPSTPDDPENGYVWKAIVGQIDQEGSESEFVSVSDTPRSTLAKYPWSIGGGGANDVKGDIESDCDLLGSIAQSIGITSFTLEDDAFIYPREMLERGGIDANLSRVFITGDEIRDWHISPEFVAIFPYDDDFQAINLSAHLALYRWMWRFRVCLSNSKMFGKKTKVEAGLKWWEYGRLTASKLREPLSIAFAFVATHNHFVLDRGGKVFNRHAQVIKLPSMASENDHLGLLGLLNSSVACFWLKQVSFNKGDSTDSRGARTTGDPAFDTYEFGASTVAKFPVSESRPTEISVKLDSLSTELSLNQPSVLCKEIGNLEGVGDSRDALAAACRNAISIRRQMIAYQEELDWQCYTLYGLAPNECDELHYTSPPEVDLGERAFEIVLARRIAAGREATTWFERHGSRPVTEVPSHWPEDYRQVVQRRIELIERDRNIGLIERPEYKRRWNTPAWDDLERNALRGWLLDRLESPHLWPASDERPPQFTTVHRLADAMRSDSSFMQIAELYAGHSGFDAAQIVAELVSGESVPFLPVLRYKDSGLRKHAQWEDTWALQRREDAGESVGPIPVPPKYQSADFLKSEFWRLRGGLDVPKERWISFPGCERGADGSLVIAWAGWNHLQQAIALAAYYLDMKDNEGWETSRLIPLLAGLLELLPWLKQWHNEYNAADGARMGDYFEGFVLDEAKALGRTADDLRGWVPDAPVRRARRTRSAT